MSSGMLSICQILVSLQANSFYTDDSKKVVTVSVAEQAVGKAYRKGRGDIIKNIPELNWVDGGEWYDTGVKKGLFVMPTHLGNSI